MPGKVGRPRKQPPRPPFVDRRQSWQIAQGNACGCRGQDDMCPCQNESPWPRPFVDWKARAEAAEAKLAALAQLERP